ncbi:MAG TPA: hypothetical protein VD735_06350 [Candidatus Saccharimonadales bacterium]|nr:hypothetical protein [Candidatus Saccharimonadales bacterium]
MRPPTLDPIPVLRTFRATRGASIDAGVRTMFRHLDVMPHGLTVAEVMECTGHNRATVFTSCQALQARGCLATSVAESPERGKNPTLWIGTPKLAAVAAGYNELLADIMSPHISEATGRDLLGGEVRALALGRLAGSLRLNVASTDEDALFAATPARLGHAHTVANRALLSLAAVEGVERFVENEIMALTR